LGYFRHLPNVELNEQMISLCIYRKFQREKRWLGKFYVKHFWVDGGCRWWHCRAIGWVPSRSLISSDGYRAASEP
jgi:hypothetical protein